MAWIKVLSLEEATGLLAQLYREGGGRARQLWDEVRRQSQRPATQAAAQGKKNEVME